MKENNHVDGDFNASRGSLTVFMKRNGLPLRRKTSVAQQDLERLVAKLQRKHNYGPSDIIAIDETPVWCHMISETTIDAVGKKSITLKTTGHQKARVSICLAARADWTEIKPIVVFKGAKREVASLKQELQHRAVIPTSANAWIDTELTEVWINYLLGASLFSRRLLAWDSFECHIEDNITDSLKSKAIDRVIVPGGCTKYTQAPDVSWNKPFNPRALKNMMNG